MKKLFALSICALLLACSSDDEGKKECENKVWNMTQTGGQYFATYGETAATAGTVQVNQQTYEFYVAQGNVTDGSVCWDGTRE